MSAAATTRRPYTMQKARQAERLTRMHKFNSTGGNTFMRIFAFIACCVSPLFLLSGCTRGFDETGEIKVVLIPDWSSPAFAYEVFFKTDRGIFHLEFSEACTLEGNAEVSMDGDGFPLSVCQRAITTHSAGSYRITGIEQTDGNKLSTCPTTSLLVHELELLKRGEGVSHVSMGWVEKPGASRLVTDSVTGNVGREIVTRDGIYASAVLVPTSVLNGKLSVNGTMDVRPSSPPASWANCEFDGAVLESEPRMVEGLVIVLRSELIDAIGIDPGSLDSNIDAARAILLDSKRTEWDNLLQDVYDLEVFLTDGSRVPLGAISNFEHRTIEPSYVGDESTFVLLRAE